MDQRDFFACDLFDVAAKDDLATMEHPMFSLSTKPDREIRRYEHNGASVVITPSVKGRATIHDKDILIYCVSQLMAGLNAGREPSRRLSLVAHDLLVATRRDTGGDGYTRLVETFERLAGTRITTNIETGGVETTSGFGLIESWEIVRISRGGRMVSVNVTLSEWLYRAVLSKSVLTLHPDYFSLRKPLERRVYELARKHCGQQPEWRIKLPLLQLKVGSEAPLRVFRAALRKMALANTLPQYAIEEEGDDIFRFYQRREPVGPAQDILFGPEVYDELRHIAPGFDVYALVQEWQSVWQASGSPVLRSPQAALKGWVKKKVS